MKLPLFLTLLAAVPALAQTGATPADKLTVAPGFKVELLKSADPKRDGSWISMAIDAKGRLYISPQGAIPESGFAKDAKWGGLVRVTLDDKGQIAQWERVPVPIGDAMGMLWAFDSLYVSGNGPEGRGIYRLMSEGMSGHLDSWTMWKKVPGGAGEHGAHALVLGPDGKSIYIVHGNSTPLIDGLAPDSPYKNYREDDLLPRVLDPVATFFDKMKTPYGYVLRTDEHGTKWELLAGGFRNPYDLDFNADGELFTYDSDMEWDVGLPWYRPTRVLHVVPGGEYGFREGSAKWPAYYPDSLPAAVDIGLGCPTGVKFGTRSNFPEKYRRAFFIMDWTFGRILAVHLHPRGASYAASMGEPPRRQDAKGGERANVSATTTSQPLASSRLGGGFHPNGPQSGGDVEVFLTGKGLPVTDLEFGTDGAMYFTIGGRGTQAGLYRVSYVGKPLPKSDGDLGEQRLRQTRLAIEEGSDSRFLEKYAGVVDADRDAMVGARRGMLSEDPFLRSSARGYVEKMYPRASLNQILLDETEPRRAFSIALALARVGTKEDQAAILQALAKFPLDALSEELKLDKLRVITVALARHGRPSPELVQMGLEKLLRQYPAKTFALNRELCQLLVYLASGVPDLEGTRSSGSPTSPLEQGDAGAHRSGVIEKTLALIDASPEPAEQVWYALCLREAAGWTPAQRERYFGWFAKAKGYKGGNSFAKFILRIRDQALEKVPVADRPALLALAGRELTPAKPTATLPPRAFVKAWTLDELLPALPEADRGRDFARGKALYTAAQCAQCHTFAGEGGATGPDLTAVGSRFSRKDILEAILDPNKGVSEQYAVYRVVQFDGKKDVVGMIVEETNDALQVLTDPVRGTTEMISKYAAPKRELVPASIMPPGLLSTLTKDEVLDLLAYMESGGNEKAPAFAR